MIASLSPGPSGRRTVAVVQARMGSTRFPGKVLADIVGRPMLGRMLDRLERAQTLAAIAVATTTNPDDDSVARFCLARGIVCVRGHPTDVLDRYTVAAEQLAADVIVRLTGDCPLIDPGLVDACVRTFLEAAPPVDLVLNRLPWSRTYPIGLDTEVVSRAALETAWREARQPHQREHVVPFLYENLDRFRMIHLNAEADYGRHRWTVDTPEDLEVVRRIYQSFEGRDDFDWREVLALMEREPSLAGINAHIVHRTHRDVDRPEP